MQVPSGWPRIFFVIYWRRKSATGGGSAAANAKGRRAESEMGKDRRAIGKGERGEREIETGNLLPEASSLHSLQKETIMRIRRGKDSRLSREYIVKMQASAHSR